MLDIGLFDPITNERLGVGPWLDQAVLETNEHGFSQLTARARLPLGDAFLMYARTLRARVKAIDSGVIVWDGRLEDVSLTDDGLLLKAFGFQRALSDAPYTALWSLKRYDAWRAMTIDDRVNTRTEKYEADNNNRIFIAPRKNEAMTKNSTLGRVGYAAPDRGVRYLVVVTFSYDVYLDSGWDANLVSSSGGLGGTPTAEWTVAGNGASQTGTATVTLTNATADALRFEVNPATGTYAGETGDRYFKITNLRIKSTTSASVYADEIARAIVATVAALNATQLATETVLIESPALDLTDQVYEDRLPADILNSLIALGDNQTPPRQWEWGVWEGQRLHLRPRGSAGRAWYVDATRLEIERTLEALYNTAYAVYNDERGETKRTAASTDATSLADYGLTRSGYVSSDTTSATQAGVERDTALDDTRNPRPRSALVFDRLYDAAGAAWPKWMCHSGDTITIRNLPPQLNATLDRVRTFTLSETRYSTDDDRLEVTPESPLPKLEVLLARKEAGL